MSAARGVLWLQDVVLRCNHGVTWVGEALCVTSEEQNYSATKTSTLWASLPLRGPLVIICLPL